MLVRDLIKIEGFSGFQILIEKRRLSKLEHNGLIVDNQIAYCKTYGRNKGFAFGNLFLASAVDNNDFVDINLSCQLSSSDTKVNDYKKIADFVDSAKYRDTDKKIFKISYVINYSAKNILEIYLDVNR